MSAVSLSYNPWSFLNLICHTTQLQYAASDLPQLMTAGPLKRICLLGLLCLCAYFQFLLVNEIMLPLLTLHLVYMIYSHLL